MRRRCCCAHCWMERLCGHCLIIYLKTRVERVYGVLIESIGKNKYKIQFDNGAMNGVQSSILQLKQITFGLSPQKLLLQHPTIQVMLITAVLATVLTTESSSFGSSSFVELEQEMNIGDKNIPAYEDILPLKYFQRLEATRKIIKQFLVRTVTKVKTKIRISITWTFVEESVYRKRRRDPHRHH